MQKDGTRRMSTATKLRDDDGHAVRNLHELCAALASALVEVGQGGTVFKRQDLLVAELLGLEFLWAVKKARLADPDALVAPEALPWRAPKSGIVVPFRRLKEN